MFGRHYRTQPSIAYFAWESICLITCIGYLSFSAVLDAPTQQSDIASRDRSNSITVCQSPGSPSSSSRSLLAPDGSGPTATQSANMVTIQSQVDKFMAADFSNLVSSATRSDGQMSVLFRSCRFSLVWNILF